MRSPASSLAGGPNDAPRAAVGARSERLDRLPIARLDRVGRPRPRDRRRRRRRRHLESDHLRQSPVARVGLRRPDREQLWRSQRVSSTPWQCATSPRPAICCGRSGRRPEAATGTSRSRSTRTLAADTDGSIAQATHFHETIARPNLLVKIPATDAGVPAIEEMTARGYSINVTLIFSLNRHRQVAEAYLRGLGASASLLTATRAGFIRSPASLCRASTARPTVASPLADATISAADWRSPTPSSPTSNTRSCSPARAGRRSRHAVRPSSAACGRRPRRRTPATATRSMSTS